MAEADPKIAKPKAAKLTPAFAVRIDAFLRVKPYISDEEVRYYLNGVAVQPCKDGGALCVATDGHRLGVRRDEAAICDRPVIVKVPKELKLPARSLFPTMPWLVCMEAGGKGHLSLVAPEQNRVDDVAEAAIANVDDCIMRWGDMVIDGTFPDWPRIVPSKEGMDTIGLNGDYVKSFGRHLSISGKGKDDPRIIQDENDKDFLGVLMPMRTHAGGIPSWLKVKSK